MSALTWRRKPTRCRPPHRIKLKIKPANRPLRPHQVRNRLAKRSNPSSKSLNQPRRLRPRLLRRPAPRRLLNHPRARRAVQIKLEIKAANRPLHPRRARSRPVMPSNPISKSLSQPKRLRHHLSRRPTLRHPLNRHQPRRVQPLQRPFMTTWQRVALRARVERPGNRRRSPTQRRPRVMPGQGVLYSGSARRAIRSSPARTCSVRRFPALSGARQARRPASTIRLR